MKLSIIIPVYRVEATLDRCIESIVGQTFDNFELILVDDGSPDRCPQLCDEWARRDERIRVIHRQNGGLSAARNTGIEAATAEFITFADSDDYLGEDTYTKVMPQAETCDILEFPVYRFFGSKKQALLSFADRTFHHAKDYWLEGRAYEHAYAWNKIYRRSLFNKTRFPEGRVFEDVATLPSLLSLATSIKTCSQGIYYYFMNLQGITQTAKGAELEMLLRNHLAVIDTWCDAHYYLHVLNIQMDVSELTGQPPLLSRRFINPFSRGLSVIDRLKASALTIFGIKGICKINRFIHQHLHLRHS